MADLKCKNCGGSIYLDEKTQQLTCDSCGTSQRLNTLIYNSIFDDASVPRKKLEAYRRGVELLKMGDSEITLFSAAEEFRKAQDLFNAPQLAEECAKRADLFRQDRLYNQAVELSQSDDSESLQEAVCILESLGEYNDAVTILSNAKAKLEEALNEYELQRKQKQLQQKRIKSRKKWVKILSVSCVVLILGILIVNNWLQKRPGNINITITPNETEYMSKGFNNYIFHYDVQLENKSPLDLAEIEAEVIFETEDGTILVDTSFRAGTTAYKSAPILRGKRKNTFSWSVTISSEDRAMALYQQDFENLNVVTKISELQFHK